MNNAATVIGTRQTWVKLDCLIEIGQGSLHITKTPSGEASIVVGADQARVTVNRAIEIRDRFSQFTLITVYVATVVISAGVSRIDGQGLVVIDKRLVQLPSRIIGIT